MHRTTARLSWSALGLACAGALLGGCSAAPPTARPAAPPRSAAEAAAPTEPPPVRALAVTDGYRWVLRHPTAAATATGPAPTARRTPRRPPRPNRPHAPGTLCDLGERYGGWPVGSAQDAVCRGVYR